MKKLIIKNKLGEILQTAIFDNQEKLDDFKEVLKQGAWGLPEHQRELTPAVHDNETGIMKTLLLITILLLSSCATKRLIKISECDNVAADIFRCGVLK
jgi:hypothetical protein